MPNRPCPPPKTTHPLKGKPETGMNAAVMIHSQVTGDGHGGQPFGSQPFSLQPPEARCQFPMAERPDPEHPMSVPVTRHLKMYAPQLIIRFPVSL